ncbi:MAG: hypothetical protein KF870_15775 [Leadbetterella sp.]|nr:hypothetical protein [Leadbetterella sp.]
MKGFLYTLFASFILLGCSKDNKVDPETDTKSVNIGGKSITFEGAGVIDYGYDDSWEEYNMEFILTSSSITSGKTIVDFPYSLYLQAYVANDKFMYGTYKAGADDMYGGAVFIEKGKNEMYMTTGSFTISKESNGDLKLQIDGILMDGRELKGTYIGTFADLDENFVETLWTKESTFKIRN